MTPELPFHCMAKPLDNVCCVFVFLRAVFLRAAPLESVCLSPISLRPINKTTTSMKAILVLLNLLCTFASVTALATQSNSSFTGTGEIFHAYGGETLAKVPLENGFTDNVRISEGSGISIGIRHWLNTHWSIKYTAGYRYKSTNSQLNNCATNVRLTSYPITFMPSFHWQQQSLGIGATYFIDTTLEFSGSMPEVSFDDSVGITFEYRYQWIGISYTVIDYKLPHSKDTLKGDHFSIKFMEEF